MSDASLSQTLSSVGGVGAALCRNLGGGGVGEPRKAKCDLHFVAYLAEGSVEVWVEELAAKIPARLLVVLVVIGSWDRKLKFLVALAKDRNGKVHLGPFTVEL